MAFERGELGRTLSTVGTLVASTAGIPVRTDVDMNYVAQEQADCFGLLFGRERPSVGCSWDRFRSRTHRSGLGCTGSIPVKHKLEQNQKYQL